jgi:hypothetical protein
MQYYSAKLRLAGSTMNEVRNVYSAPEILILQYIHGVDALTEIKKVKEERMNMRDYKDQLKAKYDQALVKREQSIDKIFGALGQLPTKLPDHILEANDIVDEDDVVAVAKAATRSEKNSYVPQTPAEQQRVDTIVPANEVDINDIIG